MLARFDIVLVAFPFTDGPNVKPRPAMVIGLSERHQGSDGGAQPPSPFSPLRGESEAQKLTPNMQRAATFGFMRIERTHETIAET
jgi:hypothetical protein